MNRRNRRRSSVLIALSVIFGAEVLVMFLLNTTFVYYFDDDEIKSLKEEMLEFSQYHKTKDGLFIYPDIHSNYASIDSINFTKSNDFSINFVQPLNNSNLQEEDETFFFDYFLEKQNTEGSFSDVSGAGNMVSTYELINLIDIISPLYLESEKAKTDKVIKYIESMEVEGGGFKIEDNSDEPDLVSTYQAVELADRFDADYLIRKDNISKFVNSTYTFGGYRLSASSVAPNAESTYYGIKNFLNMNMNYMLPQRIEIGFYLNSLHNLLDGGYASTQSTNKSNVHATNYVLMSFYLMGMPPFEENKTLDYLLSCVNADGGFASYYDSDKKEPSDFSSGLSVMNALKLIEYNSTINVTQNLDLYRKDYYNWLYDRQSIGALFGRLTVESNYWGVLAAVNYPYDDFENIIDIQSIWNFVKTCYDSTDGGFGSEISVNSSSYATYCVVNIYDIFNNFTSVKLPDKEKTIDYLSSMQNEDGGFRLDQKVRYLSDGFGYQYELLEQLLKEDESIVEGAYLAVKPLQLLNALDTILSNKLRNWISACQNIDGGFPAFIGFHSDVISTYHAVQVHKIMGIDPMSKIDIVKFLQMAQSEDGGFAINPALTRFYDIPPSFISTYFSAITLYGFKEQPRNITALIDWYKECISEKTGGVGDVPNSGGDLRNTPYGMDILQYIRYDRSINPEPWNQLLMSLIIIQIAVIASILVIVGISYAKNQLVKKKRRIIDDTFISNQSQTFPALNCEDLNIYADGNLIVDSVTLEIQHGQILGVLGESGSGKTTFIKALLGTLKYTGTNDIYGLDAKKRRIALRSMYGYVPQDISKIYHNVTVLENLIIFGKQYNISEKEIIRRSKTILKNLGIEDKMHQLVKHLSGGERKRASIAIALVHYPPFCILDEPTSGLDPIVRENLWLALTRINERLYTTLVVVTHYPEESRFCHKVAIFGRNRGMIDYGSPKELLYRLPGNGRTLLLSFKEPQNNAVERLESINGVDKVLINRVDMDFCVYSDLNQNQVMELIGEEFGPNNILKIDQSDSRMEEYFRYKSMEVPNE